MDDLSPFYEYIRRIDEEKIRIGFTPADFRYLGSGGPLSVGRFEAELAELATIQCDIGAQAYYARWGVDFAALVRDIERRTNAQQG
jgi:hypothetical protein